MQRLIMSLICMLPFSLGAQTLQFVGTAFAPESRQPIYTERYTEQFNADGKLVTGTVLYREYDGAALGEKFLDYAPHPYAPAFAFTNVKTGYQESVRWLPDGKVRLAHREPGQDEQEKVMSIPEPAVADAGFNQFMRDNIAALKNGETLEFNFLNPARLTWFRFTARRTAQTDDSITVLIAPANTVLRWLVEPIELVYSEPEARLLHYRGLTNISLSGSKTINAHIDYEYHDSSKPAQSAARHLLEYRSSAAEG